MRKEVVFAIIAGISIGLIIAFGAWKAAQSFKRPVIVTDSKKTPPTLANISLTINGLSNYDIITVSPLKVTGLSYPESEIVVSTTEEDYFTKSNKQGEFELEMELPEGLSEIKFNEQKLKLVYSTELEVETNSKLKAVAYVGTITDLSSGTIQIKADAGEIKQLSYDDETIFVNTLKKNIEVKPIDLAIGDHILAMGLINGNKVLDTKRVLISEPMEENQYEVVTGTIESIVKNKITLKKADLSELEIVMPKTWNGPEVADLSEGQRIITIGTFEKEIYTLRTIFTTVE